MAEGVRKQCAGCIAKANGASRWQVAFVLGRHHEREHQLGSEVELCKVHERMIVHHIAGLPHVA